MNLEVIVFTSDFDDKILYDIIKKMNEFDMTCEVHPNIKLNEHSGFLPFKFKFTNSTNKRIDNKELISGFEFYINDFNVEDYSELIKDNNLKKFNKALTFSWSYSNTFELRFALLTSSIFTQITNSVLYYPSENYWYDNNELVNNIFKDILDFENSLKLKEINFHEFESWSE
ncbi:hypothetical protein IF125_10260 [Empedobacter stercoris]|uniref:hypothetical protein n=1 Tax=Empedobacter stercoris TaxID=1628248 RepID=UPI001CE10A5F|nr:hypothetical protein [Empedobacter stercoris]MCA4782642.1 hypothetical protein [Empedobacter stercoris]